MKFDIRRYKEKKVPYALKLRPTTIDMMEKAARAADISKNLVVERGTRCEARKILRNLKKGIDFDSGRE